MSELVKIKPPAVQAQEHAERVRKQVEYWWPQWREDMVTSANRAVDWHRDFIMMPWLSASRFGRNFYATPEEYKQESERLRAEIDIGYPCDEAHALMAERFVKELRESGWTHARVSYRERIWGGWERVIELSAEPNARERGRYLWFAVAGVIAGVVAMKVFM